MRNPPRIIGAAILSPLALAVLATLPAIGSMAAFQWALISAAICFPLFWICAGISHVILRLKNLTRLSAYIGVMFGVATMVMLTARVAILHWIFGNGGSEFHFGTQVVDNGTFTLQGVLLLTAESMFGAIWLSAAFGLFWFIGVRESRA